MTQIWLKSNCRAYLLLAILPASVLVGCLVVGFLTRSQAGMWIVIALSVASLAWLAMIVRRIYRPRLAYDDGTLLVYLRGSQPISVPIDIVECFFLGQGASLLPKALSGKDGEATEAATVVVRLAEAATEWRHLDVDTSLGHWCEGYITIRGTWCEPLNGNVVAALNQRLVAAHRAQKKASETVSA